MKPIKYLKHSLLSPYFMGSDARSKQDPLLIMFGLATLLGFIIFSVLFPMMALIFSEPGAILILVVDLLLGIPANIKVFKYQSRE